jgi:uncharacterized protein (TIGR03382 family)
MVRIGHPGGRAVAALLGTLACAGALLLAPGSARAVVCDDTELLCLDLTSEAEVTAAGGVLSGGDFTAEGFQPFDQGGLDWVFGPLTDLSWGRLEVDVIGLQPNATQGELEGGKVSIFSLCGLPPEEIEDVGLQKMAFDYRDGNIFRYGMDDDGLADNWDAVVITGADFGCYFSIADPPWQPGETHHLVAEWGPQGVVLTIDALECTGPGNGDTFDPVMKRFVVANRCQHYANQQPLARLRNLRLWAASHVPCEAPDQIQALSITPAAGSGQGDVFTAVYRHCLGADQLRVVELLVADDATLTGPGVRVAFEAGAFSVGAESCTAGEARVLPTAWGSLDCSRSSAQAGSADLTVTWALDLDAANFSGAHSLWLQGAGGPGDPEPHLGWTPLGTYTVIAPGIDAGPPAPDAAAPGDAGPFDGAPPDLDAGPDAGPDAGSSAGHGVGGCGCSGPGATGTDGLALLVLWLLCRRRRARGPGARGEATALDLDRSGR